LNETKQLHNLVPPSRGSVSGVRIIFEPARTRLTGYGLLGLDAPAHATLKVAFIRRRYAIDATWSPCFAAHGQQISLMTECDDEPLIVWAQQWKLISTPDTAQPEKSAREQVHNLFGDDPSAFSESFNLFWQGDPLGTAPSPVDLVGFARLAPKERSARFFRKLDLRTTEGGNEAGFVAPQKAAMPFAKMLKDRLMGRLKNPPENVDLPAQILSMLSKTQLDTIDLVWPGTPTAKAAAVADAFVMFSQGLLAIDPVHFEGQPNSANFFFFAEFAIAALRGKRLDPASETAWRAYLPALVSSQIVYLDTYQPAAGTPRVWENWVHTNNVPARQTPRAVLQRAGAELIELTVALDGDLDTGLTLCEERSAAHATQLFVDVKPDTPQYIVRPVATSALDL
jgi:hypothetical protein